jgi:UDP-N-acetylmuramoyl-L-alanyl-D-glutamate--2,6-diaminopimelate ligase
VINQDSAYAKSLVLLAGSRGIQVITYGVEALADLKVHHLRLHNTCIEFDLHYHNQAWKDIRIPVVGNFQVENILCAVGMVMVEGIALESIVAVLPQLQSAPGRMQLAGTTCEGAAIYVDYAHTPDALTRALAALKSHLVAPGQLHVVFGCGGNRDTGKRNAMGAVADAFADVVYVTDDNPRMEDPGFIRAQVLSGCPKGIEVADRFIAIKTAIKGLGASDILLVAGKGHESGQVIGPDVIPFDDVQVVQEILNNHKIRLVR